MEQANAARSLFAVFVGGEEEQSGSVRVRNMKSGEEDLIDRRELVSRLAKLLSA
jgi:histidyl-tRNA synthetase